jgi:branched-chain amino acid transport system substrate-binding protein
MTSIVRRNISRRGLLAGTSATFALGVFPSYAQSLGNFRIGIIGSLTGPAAAYSREYVEGLLAYVRAWNERGGAKGHTIVAEVLDDETDAANAVTAFRREATDPSTRLIWAALGSQTALAIKAIAGEFKVPVVSGGGVDKLGVPAEPWFFKVSQGSSALAEGLIAGARKRNVKTLATLNGTDATGQDDARNVRALAKAAGIEIVAAESFALTDKDFSAQLVRIREAKADLFWNQSTGGPAIIVYKQARQLQIKTPMAVSFAAVSGAFFRGIGGSESAAGIFSVIPLGALAGEVGGEVTKIYKDACAALGKPALLFDTIGWDTALLTEYAVNASDGTRDGIRATLDKVKDLPAINGPFTYTPQNHIGQDARGLIFARFDGSKWTIAT